MAASSITVKVDVPDHVKLQGSALVLPGTHGAAVKFPCDPHKSSTTWSGWFKPLVQRRRRRSGLQPPYTVRTLLKSSGDCDSRVHCWAGGYSRMRLKSQSTTHPCALRCSKGTVPGTGQSASGYPVAGQGVSGLSVRLSVVSLPFVYGHELCVVLLAAPPFSATQL